MDSLNALFLAEQYSFRAAADDRLPATGACEHLSDEQRQEPPRNVSSVARAPGSDGRRRIAHGDMHKAPIALTFALRVVVLPMMVLARPLLACLGGLSEHERGNKTRVSG